MTCQNCGADTTNGLELCERCQVAASVYLEYMPVYFRNLARWRPAQAGSRPVPGSREPRGPQLVPPDRIARALDEAGAALATWTAKLAIERNLTPPDADDESDHVAALCRWFAQHLTTIGTLSWAGDFMRTHRDENDNQPCHGIGYHEGRLRRLTEEVAPGWYAGACQTCGNPTYVVPGLTWVTCNGITGYADDAKTKPIRCGATTYARDHLDVILEESHDWVATPVRLAEAIVALTSETSVDDIRKRIATWAARDRIQTIRAHDYAPKQHQLGEVLARLAG